jgi:hypothetical protein
LKFKEKIPQMVSVARVSVDDLSIDPLLSIIRLEGRDASIALRKKSSGKTA